MANHGYIRRDGQNIGVLDVTKGLKKCYGLSSFLAFFLAAGGWTLLRRVGKLSLNEIGRHGRIEHDASLVHQDTPPDDTFAPIAIQPDLVDALLEDAEPSLVPPSPPPPPSSGETSNPEKKEPTPPGELKKVLVNEYDVAKARVRREKSSPTLDGVHAEIARGEMGIILGVFENQIGEKKGIPVDWLRTWIGEERLPKEFKPTKVQEFMDVKRRSKVISDAMVEIRKKEAGDGKQSTSKESTEGLIEKKPQSA
ncbi:hypothetical protein BDN72DRAFT_838846 [Pluteus cervinus]|uniref:Uncharacterized protein n=1 Tax=Pluteus cervinus TaxID=181527 RepID=A0ACD3AY08_9AGAR|nr:hypothetical protein BDN72DRAFT_838846 [Pluteus cervinus]